MPAVKTHTALKGFPANSKILLILNNYSAHPSATVLNKENAETVFLPLNCRTLIHSMYMGVLQACKCHYISDFLQKMLSYVNDEKSALEFVKSFTLKDSMWSAVNAWKEINFETLKNAWCGAICCPQSCLMMTMKTINAISKDFPFPKKKLFFLNF